MATKVSVRDWAACPNCHAPWAYIENGVGYSHLIGIEFNDRIQAWRCPSCSKQWPRDD